MLCAARAQHVREVIEPALAAGAWVLCDRFVLATLAYQGYGRGLPLDVLRGLCHAATSGRMPDLTFLIDVPVDVSFERVRERTAAVGQAADRLEREGASFHARVREGYLALAAADPDAVVVLDGTLPPRDVTDAALARIARLAR